MAHKKFNIHLCILRVFSVIGWFVFGYCMVLIQGAAPPWHIDRTFKIPPPTTWNIDKLESFLDWMLVLLAISGLGCIFNAFEHQHRRVLYRVNLFVMAIVAVMGIGLYYLVR